VPRFRLSTFGRHASFVAGPRLRGTVFRIVSAIQHSVLTVLGNALRRSCCSASYSTQQRRFITLRYEHLYSPHRRIERIRTAIIIIAGDVRASSFLFQRIPLLCNVLIRLCCMMVTSMTTGQSRVHHQTNFVIYCFNF